MRTSSYLLILILTLLMAAFLGALAYYTYSPPSAGPAKDSPSAEGLSLARTPPSRPIVSSTDPIRGNPAAPVTIIEFGDFLCPACAEIAPIVKELLNEYAGKIRLVWKDFPNTRRHALAQKAAEAARCAGEQGKFWEYHDQLLARQGDVAQSFSSDVRPEGLSYFTVIARELGLNTTQFSDCLTSERTRELVSRTFNEGILLRVDGTPYFFINEKSFPDIAAAEEFKKAIDAVYAK